MKFCTVCNNLLYMSIDPTDPNHVINKCHVCDHVEDLAEHESVCVLNTNIKQNEQRFNLMINEYTKEDPTIPHIYNVKCPNSGCKTNVDNVANTDVMYIRYDDLNLKYLYVCVECNTVWK
jgi:DNA-directed RNA polymerase subunit M/transcription elongation factor TFIIS